MNKIHISSYYDCAIYHFPATVSYRLVIFNTKLAHRRTSTKMKCMYIACLYIVCLNICSLFYLNVNIQKQNKHFCYQIMFPIMEKTRFSLYFPFSCVPLDIFVQKGSLRFYFYIIFCCSFLRFFILISIPPSSPAIASSPLLCVSNSKADITSCL